MKPLCVMLVGISGSGKSTLAKQLKEKNNFEVFSSDEIRKELWGDENIQSAPSVVFNELHRRITSSLKEGKDCVYDATNLSIKRRAAFIRMVKNSNIDCYFYCHVVIATPTDCIERDRERARTVGFRVIWGQIKQFEVPSYSEGWDSIKIIWNSPVKINLDNLIEAFSGTFYDDHDNHNHSLPISEHMKRTFNYVSAPITLSLRLAARYHDIGKYFTKSNFDRKGNLSKESHFYNHQNVGAYLFLCSTCTEILSNYGSIETAFLIQHHMEHHIRDKESLKKFYKEHDSSLIKELHLLEEADMKAH